MNITDFCALVLKAPLVGAYDWSCENETNFFYLGWQNAADMKQRKVRACRSEQDAIAHNAPKQRIDKMVRERNKLLQAHASGKTIYYVLRAKQNPESDGDWQQVAKSKPVGNQTVILRLNNIQLQPDGSVIADIIERRDAKSFRTLRPAA